jgi:hypothetical protein
MTEKICPECNGEGVVDRGTEDERRCPTCNGSGIVPDDGQESEEVWNAQLPAAGAADRSAAGLNRRWPIRAPTAHRSRRVWEPRDFQKNSPADKPG